ncbi:MAG: gephyrin-like molybdotransferase Glp [Cytophagales bacterium]
MISVSTAKKIIEENQQTFGVHEVKINEGLGAVLAENVISEINVPSFDNAAMDGYALRGIENQEGWKVIHSIAAGDGEITELKEGEAARIFTGAMIPKGCDAVLVQEEAVFKDHILFGTHPIRLSQHIRREGEQCVAGDVLLKKGSILNVGMIALLASCGIEKVMVFKKPKVFVILTGNELMPLGKPLEKGKIYDSNRWFIEAYLAKLNITDVEFLHIKDEKQCLESAINQALEICDVLIITGGVSVGEHDHVKEALKNNDVEELFHKIKQKPGKPLLVGRKNKQMIFGLPGNPVSVALCFNQYVKPFLMHSIGHNNVWKSDAKATLSTDFKKKQGLTHFLKIKLKGDKAVILKGQESFNMISFAEMSHFALIPEDVEQINHTEVIELFEW